MKPTTIIVCLALSVFGWFGPLQAQDRQLKELSDSIRTLSTELATLKNDLEIRAQAFELKADQILYEKSQEIDEKVAEAINTQWWIMGLLGLLTVGGIGGFFTLLSKNKQRVETAMKERMDDLIKSKQGYFQDLIRNQEIESRIFAEDKLFVVSATAAAEREIQSILNSLDFSQKNVEYVLLGPEQGITKDLLPKDRIIVINNDKGSLGIELVREIFASAPPHAIMLGYTTGKDNRLPYDPRLNNANSKFTLYNNLILLAKFRRIAGKK
jgi:hypothetical protein